MLLIDRVLERIERNSTKEHNCIPFTDILPRLSDKIPGIEQGMYYIVSGISGSGKTQLTDHVFVFTPFDFVERNKSIKLKIFYYSMEIDPESKMLQWVSRRLFTDYGIRTGKNILDSKGKFRADNSIKLAARESRDYLARLEDKITFYNGSVNPQGVINDIENYAKMNGKVFKRKETFRQHESDGTMVNREVEVFDHYEPNNPDEYVFIILDHIGLLNEERLMSKKQTIEKLSSYLVKAKNRYRYIPVVIQQQAAEKEDVEHFKASKMEPSKDGLGESKLTYNDCDIAMGIFQPQKHDIKVYKGYQVIEMQDNYRSLSIFKNRFGESNVNVGMYFDGGVNYFRELPKADAMNTAMYEAIKKKRPLW